MLHQDIMEIKKNSMLDFFVNKLGISLTVINPEAIEDMRAINLPPGLTDKLPDNIIEPGSIEIPSDYKPIETTE